MTPGEKYAKMLISDMPQILLRIITVKVFYWLKAMRFGFADEILNQ